MATANTETRNQKTEKSHNGMMDGLESLSELSSNIVGRAEDMVDRAGEVASNVSETVSDYYSDTKQYVKKNPVKGMAIAAGVGLAAGYLLTACFSKKK